LVWATFNIQTGPDKRVRTLPHITIILILMVTLGQLLFLS